MFKRCNKYTDCDSCEHSQKDIFKFQQYPRGIFIPKERCLQNTIYFLLKGEVWINSSEHPDTILREGDFVLQPAGSIVEFRIHTPAEVIVHLFDHLQNICKTRFQGNMDHTESPLPPLIVMQACTPLCFFLEGMKMSLNDDMLCAKYMQSKQTELFFLLNYYYTLEDLSCFYAPVYNLNRGFRYFVMNNYRLVKDVKSFADLAGYSVPAFRKLFKETFDETVYQWILKQRCRDIHTDITTTGLSITEISIKHGFDSLANFSHFCRANFGKSPRALRSE
jgi:AraC-like DNA-binding protein